MSVRKTVQIVAASALLAASLPAFADHGDGRRGRDHWRDRAFEHRHPARHVVVERPVYVQRRVVVERPVYVEPAPVYGYGQVYEPAPVAYPAYPGYPEPVYRSHREVNVVGAAAGAAVGAVIGSQVGYGSNRGATAAVGAAIGGLIGSQF
jgi:hypothetical protein